MRVCIDTNVLVQLFGQNQVGRSTRRVNTPCPRAALKSVRAIPNPRPEDRRPKETRRPRSELIATPAEQPPIELGHSRNSDFGLLSAFGLRSSDFRAAEQDLPSTGRTLEPPCPGTAIPIS